MDLQSYQNFEQRVGIIDTSAAHFQSNTWHQVNFNVPFTEDKKVVVVPTIQNYNGYETCNIKIRNVTRFGFEILIDELINTQNNLSDGSYVSKVIGWVAYGFVPTTEPAITSVHTRSLEAAYTPAPEAAYTPAPEAAYTPAPEAAYTPAPEAAYTPAPEAAYTPAPEAAYTPAPEAAYTPAPEAAYTPAPEETYTASIWETASTPTSEPTYTASVWGTAYTPAT